MMSLFTALIITAMQVALDGTKCQDIASKEVSYLTNFDCGVSYGFKKCAEPNAKITVIIHSKYFPDSNWLKAHV